MTNSTPTLVVEQLTKIYSTANGELSILRGIDLSMNRGESLAITGPSGSGKSTLLYILGSLDVPSSGQVTLDGKVPFGLNDVDQAQFRNQKIGFIFQDHHLLPQCNVLENVLIPMLAGQEPILIAEKRARELLPCVGLAERRSHFPSSTVGWRTPARRRLPGAHQRPGVVAGRRADR